MRRITEFAISLRYITSKRHEKFISINGFFALFGIAIGVATLIIVMSVMNGFRIELMNRILGINAHITILPEGKKLDNYDELLKNLTQDVDFKFVYPVVDVHGMALFSENSEALNIKGIKHNDLLNKDLIVKNIKRGSFGGFSKKDAIILGDALAVKLGLNIGDKVRIIAPKTRTTIMGIIPKLKDYELVATFEVGMYEYDNTTGFANLELVQKHFDYKKRISSIEIIGNDIKTTDYLAYEVRKFSYDNGLDLRVYDWQKVNSSFINALKVERNVMFLIVSLIVIVAAFNIISSLVMLVNDKKKNIALLRSMGMQKGGVMRIFLYCGSLIGITGTVLGVFLGAWFSYNIDAIKDALEKLTGSQLFDPLIYFLTDLPADVDPVSIGYVAVFSIVITLLASIYPAWKAAKSEPAEIMRYE